MAEEKKTTPSSRPKKPKLFEDVRNSSNLRRLSRTAIHQFDFSKTIDDPIEVEEVKDPFEDSEQGSTYGVETLSEDDSQDTSSAPDEKKMVEGSLNERATTIGEGQYEHISRSTPSSVCFSPSYFSCIFLFLCLIFYILPVSPRLAFQIEAEMDLSLDLSFLDQTTPAPQSSVCPPSDLDVVATRSIVRHLLGLDLLSLPVSQKDAFCAVMVVLASASKVPQSKVFIS